MLFVELHKLVTGEKEKVGPRNFLRLSRNVLEAGEETVAVYSAGLWRTHTNSFLVLSIAADLHITYSNEKSKSLAHGPFEKLFVVDGLIHAGERDGNILARFDESTGHWHCLADRLPWREIDFANMSADKT
ncbi:MAG TPA: hypothetical protein VJ828_15495 [Lacipirellulaceae bacterium]|nr:hypothetical protein [Lacipirellulaceae bacterium]